MILKYLHAEYTRTRWPYFKSVDLFNRFGPGTKHELNKLYQQKKITTRESTSRYPLIELLTDLKNGST